MSLATPVFHLAPELPWVSVCTRPDISARSQNFAEGDCWKSAQNNQHLLLVLLNSSSHIRDGKKDEQKLANKERDGPGWVRVVRERGQRSPDWMSSTCPGLYPRQCAKDTI